MGEILYAILLFSVLALKEKMIGRIDPYCAFISYLIKQNQFLFQQRNPSSGIAFFWLVSILSKRLAQHCSTSPFSRGCGVFISNLFLKVLFLDRC